MKDRHKRDFNRSNGNVNEEISPAEQPQRHRSVQASCTEHQEAYRKVVRSLSAEECAFVSGPDALAAHLSLLDVVHMQPSVSVDALTVAVVSEAIPSSNQSLRESLSSGSESLIVNGEESAARIIQLERELLAARHSIAEKEAKCHRLSEMQHHVDNEVQELTEKLFQEAYKMVNDAEERRAKAEKLLNESRMKVDVLTAEVEALKIIVKSPSAQIHITTPPSRGGLASRFLSSAPSRKDKHASSSEASINGRKSLSLPSSAKNAVVHANDERKQDAICEVDPIYHREFVLWRERGAPLDENCPFLSRVMKEEVLPCLSFDNALLTDQVLTAIRTNTLELEPVNEQKPTVRTCALSAVPRFCPYRLRVESTSDWYFISLLARNRIASVCDFFTYLRYVNQGIVKSGMHDSYWDVVNLRKNMTLARLGLGFTPKTGGTRAENC